MRFRTLRVAPIAAACAAVLMAGPVSVSAQTAPAYSPPAAPAATSPAPTTPAATTPAGTTPAATTPAATGSGWAPGPGAANSDTYTGFIDTPANGSSVATSGDLTVDGWFVDTTAQGWAGADDVQVYLGQMGNGGTMVAKGVVAENRPDVSAALGNPYWSASGFFANVPGSAVPAGTQTLDVYVHTPAKGWWYEPVTVNVGATSASTTPTTPASPAPAAGAATGLPQVTITDPSENQNISTKGGDHTISGSVSEPGASAADIDRIEVWIDGERDTGTLLGTVTPASDGSWSLTFTPTHFASTHTNIYVYAHSKSTGKETETLRGFNITDQ